MSLYDKHDDYGQWPFLSVEGTQLLNGMQVVSLQQLKSFQTCLLGVSRDMIEAVLNRAI
jgi:hypothetical protein